MTHETLVEFYSKYLAVNDRIFQHGGNGVAAAKPYMTPAQYSAEQESAEDFRRTGRRISGSASLRSLVVQRADPEAGSATAYVCVDVSKTKILDKDGVDATPRDRSDVAELVVSFASGPLISESSTWSGASFC